MSRYGATLTILATTLIDAGEKDGEEREDIEAFIAGGHVSEWLRGTAETISGEKRPTARDLPLCATNGRLCGARCPHLVGINYCGATKREGGCEHQIRHIVDASALVSNQFCSREGWQERTVNCIYFGPGAACSNGGSCDDQLPF